MYMRPWIFDHTVSDIRNSAYNLHVNGKNTLVVAIVTWNSNDIVVIYSGVLSFTLE